MNELPEPLAQIALESLLVGRAPAWARLDLAGVVQRAGGELAAHGLEALVPGASTAAVVDYLAEVLPIGSTPLSLPRVDHGGGRHGDLLLVPDDNGIWLLALDASAAVERERARQHRQHELELRAELVGAGEWAGIFAALDVVLFEVDGDVMRPVGPLPQWANPVVERDDDGAPCLRVGDGLTFVQNFLADADAFWSSGETGSRRSGVWSEPIGPNEDAHFEALAIRGRYGRRVLALERLSERAAERQSLLQAAREASLDIAARRTVQQRKELLLHTIVHDLKSPLASVMGSLSLILARDLPREKVQKLVELSLRQARKQDSMIRQVMALFATEIEELEGFERDPRRAPDLRAVLREAFEHARPAYQEAGVTLARKGLGGPPLQVAGRADRLERVFWNLLHNALRHSPPGGAVRVRVDEHEDDVKVTILDDGPGVPEDLAGLLFERYVAGGDRPSGAGMGLYYCRITLRPWGGEVGHDARPEGGAAFWVRLRRAGRVGDTTA